MTKNNLIISLVGLAVFALVCFLNHLYPLYSDDWLYAFIYGSEPLLKIDSFSDIVISQYNHYLQWGGRAVVHSIAQLLIWIGEPWNDILNSAVFTFLILLICKYSTNGKGANVKAFIVLFLLSWFFLPALIATTLWLTGSANYLWGTAIVLLFLYPFYTYHQGVEGGDNTLKISAFFLFGILSGWTLENMFVAQVAFILLLIVWAKKNKRVIPKWIYAGLIGVCIGGAFMLLAPGNFIRSEHVNESLGLVDESFIYNMGYRILKVLYRYSVYILPLTLLYAAMFYVHNKSSKDTWRNNKVAQGSLLFAISAHIGCMAMVATPIFPPRAAFGIIVLMIIAFGVLYANTDLKKIKYRKIDIFLITILCIYFVGTYAYDVKNIHEMNEVFKEREQTVDEMKIKGEKNIVFYKELVLPSRYDFVDLSSDPTFWLNKQYKDYYNIESVTILTKEND